MTSVLKVEKITADLVVLGSGAAGLTAALTAALNGLSVTVLESTHVIGGTSARSSGTVWVPGNHLISETDRAEDRRQAAAYLEGLTSNGAGYALWRVYLDQAPAMLKMLDDQAGIGFRAYMTAPDYRQDVDGAASGGRPLEPLPFDGGRLGSDFGRLAEPLPELMLFGGLMVTRGEAADLLKAGHSLKGALLGIRLVARFLRDRLSYKRGTRLVLGNALVAMLLKAANDRGVKTVTGAKVNELRGSLNRVTGVVYETDEKTIEIEARHGVVLAGGGFPANPVWLAEHLPKPQPEYTPAAPGCDGSSIKLGIAAGGRFGPSGIDNALWFPSSINRRKDGSTAVYPHIVLDRAKPGLVAVNAKGERFTNEAASYHQFVRAMYAANKADAESIPAWLVCDRAFIRRYGLGIIRPHTPFLGSYVRSGYLKRARTVEALASTIGVPSDRLLATVVRANSFAETGIDSEFGKGNTLYDRSNGDPGHSPNPCLGFIKEGPFFAVAVYPTPLGTSRGLVTDAYARVLAKDNVPIGGLYACGNDMQPAFEGEYPGAGAQLGQAMTFGWIAGMHAARVAFVN